MEGFLKRKRLEEDFLQQQACTSQTEDDSTEVKLALLASIFPKCTIDLLLDALLASEGSVESAQKEIEYGLDNKSLPRKLLKGRVPGRQGSMMSFTRISKPLSKPTKMTRKGQTVHLYSPEDVSSNTPCSIIHNFLPPEIAESLLSELLQEVPSYGKETFRVFDRDVESPHTMCFYVDDWSEAERQRTEYVYNGSHIQDVRHTPPEMKRVSNIVLDAVNEEIKKRMKSHYPHGKKLKYQSPKPWAPNTSFVNCYDGGKESVGYHSDQLTYLGPRAVIGSISLGVAREFRVRKIVPRSTSFDPTDKTARKMNDERADVEGQIAIHLPHNSLLVMHAEMQEEWKHSIAPTQAIDPHPIAGNKRINVTYRCYRKMFHPRFTPKCRCSIPAVLRCVQKREENRGKYMWMCHAGYTPGQRGCTFFQWAEFDEDGEPPWAPDFKQPKIIA